MAQPSGSCKDNRIWEWCKDNCTWEWYPIAAILMLIADIVITVVVSHFVAEKTVSILVLAFIAFMISLILGPLAIVCICYKNKKEETAEAQIERNVEVVTAPTPQVMVSISPVKKKTQQTRAQIKNSNHSEPVTHSSVDINLLVNTTVTVVPRTAEQEPKPDPRLKPGIATVATKKALPPFRSGEGKRDQN